MSGTPTPQEPILQAMRRRFEPEFIKSIQLIYPHHNRIWEACSYALLGGGKRIRPVMTLLCSEIIGGKFSETIASACAVEYIHTYSLVHDDLPAMDNDSLRRGRPTTHVVYGEALGILTGDALLTDAFRLCIDEDLIQELGWLPLPLEIRMRQNRLLSLASGSKGMVLGQAIDLLATEDSSQMNVQKLNQMHLLKTGQLFGAACANGVLAAGADETIVQDFFQFGCNIGLAFQIQDDLLDEEQEIGKTPGKDQSAGKVTYLSFYTREKAHGLSEEYTEQAFNSITGHVSDLTPLRSLAAMLLARKR